MNYQNDDLRITEINELLPPVALLEKYPATDRAASTVCAARSAIHKILKGNDDRLLVVVGPCSIHDPEAALEYAGRLIKLRDSLSGELEVVMRVYFEKPRTTVGWKGLINDPQMDGSFHINKVAIDAINAAGAPHCFLSVTKWGHSAIVNTSCNADCHIILRGGREPNYSAHHVQAVKEGLTKAGLPAQVMIDCSHANSSKQFKKQMTVAEDVCQRLAAGETGIIGVMVESHLVEGNQAAESGALVYGQSVTDVCIGWDDTERLLTQLAQGGARAGNNKKNRVGAPWVQDSASAASLRRPAGRVGYFALP